MTHLPFIVASYAIALLIPAWFGVTTQLRLAKARKRLAAVDPRAGRTRP
jgi:hypothetical protein